MSRPLARAMAAALAGLVLVACDRLKPPPPHGPVPRTGAAEPREAPPQAPNASAPSR